jgi:hypothetical protein
MAIRDDFTAGEVLAAADLNDTFASKVPYAYGTATPSTTVDGFVWFDENSTPPAPKFWDGAAFQGIGGGKILQVVRATDTTNRSTTSTSYVDVTGMSVTITPQKSTSAIIILSSFNHFTQSTLDTLNFGYYQIVDSSNNVIGGQTDHTNGVENFTGSGNRRTFSALTLVSYATPATLSAVTYKLRFRVDNAGVSLQVRNSTTTGQMYAIEVSA